MELEELDYEIQFVKGKNNAAADFLSRMNSDVDHEVNDEREFVDRFIYCIPSDRSLLDEKANDPATSFAARQLHEVS